MSERVPDNLATLYEAFSQEAIDAIFPGDTYHLGDIEFVCKYAPESTAERFFIVKPIEFVEYFVEFCQQFKGGRIFELGIAEGGSTAMVALAAEPQRIVAVDLEPKPLEALDEFATHRGLTEVVRPYYGVDQSDRARLGQIVEEEFSGEPLDWVLDDASHKLEPTRASFEALFPRLRPGGTYTIEDWTADIRFRDAVGAALRDPDRSRDDASKEAARKLFMGKPGDQPQEKVSPLARLAIELGLACAATNDAVVEVTFNEHWVIVKRGSAELDPDTFRLDSLYRDYFGFLPAD